MDIQKIKIGDDTIYLKKGYDGFRIVYPIKNDDGTINWKNLIYGGNIWSFIRILFLFILLIGIIIVYHYDTKTCSNTLTHIDEVCLALQQGKQNPYLNNANLQIPSIGLYNQTKDVKIPR